MTKIIIILMLMASVRTETGKIINPTTIESVGNYWGYDTEIPEGKPVNVVFGTKGTIEIEDDEILYVMEAK